MTDKSEEQHTEELKPDEDGPRPACTDAICPGAETRRGDQIDQREQSQISDHLDTISHFSAGQVQAEPQPDGDKDTEVQRLNHAGEQDFRMTFHDWEH